jgi:hypothetical protein
VEEFKDEINGRFRAKVIEMLRKKRDDQTPNGFQSMMNLLAPNNRSWMEQSNKI